MPKDSQPSQIKHVAEGPGITSSIKKAELESMKQPRLFFILAVLVLIGAECNPPSAPQVARAGPDIWIDAPLDGSTVLFSGQWKSYPMPAISMRLYKFELSVNGAVLRTDANSDTQKPLVTMRQQWMPPAPGNYRIAVRAQNSSGIWGDYATAVVSVGGATGAPPPISPGTIVPPPPPVSPGVIVPATLTPVPPLVTRAPVPTVTSSPIPPVRQLPTPTPSPTTFAPVRTLPTPTHTSAPPSVPSFGAPTVSPNLFYYLDSHCGSKQVTVGISVTDPDGIASVEMHYRLSNKGLPSGTTSTASHPMSLVRGGWSVTINSESDIPGYNTYPSGAWFQFWMIATDTKGMQSQSPLYGNMVTLTVCSLPSGSAWSGDV